MIIISGNIAVLNFMVTWPGLTAFKNPLLVNQPISTVVLSSILKNTPKSDIRGSLGLILSY
ncbi:MAG: hypothetical protein ABI685_01875 [Ferruginibacter sp.]